jgi:hypothetical protein
MIKGCDNVTMGVDESNGADNGVASFATCVLAGRKVGIVSCKTAGQTADAVMAENKVETYWAEGNGWTAVTADDETVLRQLVSDAGWLFEHAVQTATPDVPGEKRNADAVAAALGGQTRHYTP